MASRKNPGYNIRTTDEEPSLHLASSVRFDLLLSDRLQFL